MNENDPPNPTDEPPLVKPTFDPSGQADSPNPSTSLVGGNPAPDPDAPSTVTTGGAGREGTSDTGKDARGTAEGVTAEQIQNNPSADEGSVTRTDAVTEARGIGDGVPVDALGAPSSTGDHRTGADTTDWGRVDTLGGYIAALKRIESQVGEGVPVLMGFGEGRCVQGPKFEQVSGVPMVWLL